MMVDKMQPVEAVELLSAGIAPEEIQPLRAEFTRFANDLRNYPLLLALANTAIANWKNDLEISLAEAMTLARDTFTEQGILGFDDTSASERTRAVDLTLNVSLNQLTPDEQRRYLELAIFREDASIPLTTLERYWGLSKVQTLQFCQKLYRKTALLHSFEGMAVRIHDVFRDYLIRQHMAEALQRLHGRLIDAWGDLTALPDTYAWRFIAHHLTEAGRSETLRHLLLDYTFLRAKLEAMDTPALVADCNTLSDDPVIRLIRSALTMSAHLLVQNKDALAHQLVGRLTSYRITHTEIHALTNWIVGYIPAIYPLNLDSKYPSLILAGGYLIATLSGHTSGVTGVMALADGRFLSWAGRWLSSDKILRLWDAAGTPLTVLTGHSDWVQGALALADGCFLSWSSDETL